MSFAPRNNAKHGFGEEAVIQLAVLALATVAPPLTGANAQAANLEEFALHKITA